MPIREDSLKINVFEAKKFGGEKSHVFLSHIKTRHSYDFPLYFPHEYLEFFK